MYQRGSDQQREGGSHLSHLSVVGPAPMFTKEMLVMEFAGDRLDVPSKGHGVVSHSRNRLQYDGVVCGGGRRRPPAEWTVSGHQNGRHRIRVQILKPAADDDARVLFVILSDLIGRQTVRDRNLSMKIVGVGGPQTRNRPLPLCPRRGKFGMGVSHTARIREMVVNFQVGGQIGRWAEVAFDDFTVEFGDDDVFRCQFVVGHAARFDCDQSVLPRNSAGIAEGVKHQPAPNQFEICVQNFFPQALQQHRFPTLPDPNTSVQGAGGPSKRLPPRYLKTLASRLSIFPAVRFVSEARFPRLLLDPECGASPVDSRNTRLVCSSYPVPFGAGVSRCTSANKALKARRASFACDICTVVSGGNINCARRMSSKPTSDRSRGMMMRSS